MPLSEAPASVAVLGGGLAGVTVARQLRQDGYQGELVIVDPEGAPYDRPPLSKGYLAGQATAESLLLAPRDWYGEQGIELVTGHVEWLDPSERRFQLTDGRQLAAEAVVLACGARARRLPVPGGDHPALRTLRGRRDADLLRAELAPGTRLVIVGAGLIGAEVASTALAAGAEVTLVDPADPPLAQVVGPDLAEVLHTMHRDRGVRVVTGQVARVSERGDQLVLHVDGAELVADTVLVAVGAVPHTALAEAAGLDTDHGILVDAEQRTSAPGVYAAGDCARRRRPDGTLLPATEHWDAALHQGRVVAAALLGQPAPTEPVPWFWSDRHGVHLECVGSVNGPGRTVRRPGPRGGPESVLRLGPDSALLGCAAVDDPRLVRAARRLVAAGSPVDERALTDPGVDPRRLTR
ncbi:FAD-dependent oxidoreductase [Streptomyces sp. NPDC005438]|uniref:NAD(P)/FAD-dependent oxidoreductase n=1 Tax=Streptomyces sp. NPDC005438 TaxID=3156880 RepID=UPI0033B43A4C